jgi:sec-independent protein translocase protein TatC
MLFTSFENFPNSFYTQNTFLASLNKIPSYFCAEIMAVESTDNMSFLDHLEELRWRLVRSAIAVFVVAIGIWVFKEWIIENMFLSMKDANFVTYRWFCKYLGVCIEDIPIDMQSTEVMGQFSYAINMTLMGGIVIAFPFIFYQIWSFIKPGLKEKELKVARGTVFYTSILFFTGILFGYFLIAPLTIQFFGSFQLSTQIKNDFTVSSYMAIVLSTIFFTGLLFLIPVVIYFLAKLDLVTAVVLRKYRRHAIVAVLVLAALITPPNLISQIIVAIPIMILYEISILLAVRISKEKMNSNV